MYNLIEYNYSKSLWQYYRDEPVLKNADAVFDFTNDNNNNNNNNSNSFKRKQKITGQTSNDNTKRLK